jgi:hypothetical protein
MQYSMNTQPTIKLWQGLIRPVLEFGAEVWPSESNHVWKEAQQLQQKIAKRILQCNSTTTNEAVLGELGWWKLETRRDLIRLKYWNKILNMNNNRMTKKIYNENRRTHELSGEKNWSSYTHTLLSKYNLESYWKDNLPIQPNEWERIVHKNIHTHEETTWKENMMKKPKLRTYRLIKRTLQRERYLTINTNQESRKILTSLRTGSNDLRIDTGRREWIHQEGIKMNLPAEQRICRSCLLAVDDEIHFILECQVHSEEREEMFKQIRTIMTAEGTPSNYITNPKTREEKILSLNYLIGESGTNNETDDNIKKSVMSFTQQAMRQKKKT